MGLLQRIIPVITSASATATLGVLHIALVIAGHLLDDVSVAVVAGDVDSRVGQLILDVRRGSEDYSSAGDERAAHVRHIRHTGGAHAEAHRPESRHRYGVSLSGPRLDDLADSRLCRVDGALADTASHSRFGQHLALRQLVVEFGGHHVAVLSCILAHILFLFSCFQFDCHSF